MLVIREEADEPRVRVAVAKLGGAGLGAELQTGEVHIAVIVVDDVVVHHLRELLCRGGLDKRGGHRFFTGDHMRLDERAAVCNGADVAQHRIGADGIGRLADARPAKLGVTDKVERVSARVTADAVKLMGREEAVFRDVVDHGLMTKHHGDLRESDVAGV